MAAKCKITTLSLLTVCIYVGAALLTIAQGKTAAPPTSPTAPAPQSASQLQALAAPIALYPDSLVAQILTATHAIRRRAELGRKRQGADGVPKRTQQHGEEPGLDFIVG